MPKNFQIAFAPFFAEQNVQRWMLNARPPWTGSQTIKSIGHIASQGQFINGHNKLGCCITRGYIGSQGANTLAYRAHSKVTKKIECFEYDSCVILTHNISFYHKLWMGPISYTLHSAGKACKVKKLQLIHKLPRKLSVVNMTSEVIFTTHHFVTW